MPIRKPNFCGRGVPTLERKGSGIPALWTSLRVCFSGRLISKGDDDRGKPDRDNRNEHCQLKNPRFAIFPSKALIRILPQAVEKLMTDVTAAEYSGSS